MGFNAIVRCVSCPIAKEFDFDGACIELFEFLKEHSNHRIVTMRS